MSSPNEEELIAKVASSIKEANEAIIELVHEHGTEVSIDYTPPDAVYGLFAQPKPIQYTIKKLLKHG
jgi:hypothetical protein